MASFPSSSCNHCNSTAPNCNSTAPNCNSTTPNYNSIAGNYEIISHEQDKMISETIQAILKYSAAAPEGGDEHFNFVSRARGLGWGTSVKLKGNFDEAAMERLQKSAAVTENEAFGAAAVAIAIAATPFVLWGFGGLAI